MGWGESPSKQGEPSFQSLKLETELVADGSMWRGGWRVEDAREAPQSYRRPPFLLRWSTLEGWHPHAMFLLTLPNSVWGSGVMGRGASTSIPPLPPKFSTQRVPSVWMPSWQQVVQAELCQALNPPKHHEILKCLCVLWSPACRGGALSSFCKRCGATVWLWTNIYKHLSGDTFA